MAASTETKACSSIQEKVSMNALYMNFRDVVRTKLGRKASRLSMDIFLDIAVVLVGLKPGFLFDYTFVDDPSTLMKLCELVIRTLNVRPVDVFSPHQNELSGTVSLSHTWTDMKANCRICKVADDVFVLNLRRTMDYLKLISSGDFKCRGGKTVNVVDVSHSLPKPEFATEETLLELQGMIDGVLKQLNAEKVCDSAVIKLQLEKDWNITSLFGFLLGYPVVYWYESSEGQNGLSMVPLALYKVYGMPIQELLSEEMKSCVNAENRNKHTMFSFSMPTELKQKCQPVIENWFTDLTENWMRCKFVNLFGDFELNETESVLPSVAL